MYSYITGELVEIQEGQIVIDNQGIGYNIFVPGCVIDTLPMTGSTVKIYTYLNVREDAMTLFGFGNKDELQLFKLLIGVNGIGPKGALAILSVMSADELRFAIVGDDAKAIAKAPGVGAKTAQRVILDLRDKIDLQEAFEQKLTTGGEDVAGVSGIRNEAVQALTALGYSSSESLKAMNQIDITEDMDVEALLKETLKKMAFL